jgi:hypothetical protein
MLVRRIDSWNRREEDGGWVPSGAIVEMPDDLAALHIRDGSAEPVTVPPAVEPEADSALAADVDGLESVLSDPSSDDEPAKQQPRKPRR